MSPSGARDNRPWTCFEPVSRNEDGIADARIRRRFSEELAAGGTLPTTAITKMRMLQAHGWPDAREAMVGSKGERLVVRPDKKSPEIWELKCKPSCWRLYFHVFEQYRYLVFLVAICKKKLEGNEASDATKARKRLKPAGRPGGDPLIEFEFPTR